MLKYIALLAMLLLSGCHQGVTFQFQGKTMGTSFMVKVANTGVSENEAAIIRKEIEDALTEVNRQMSPYIPDSEISVFNRLKETKPYKISGEFMEVLMTAIQINQESGGAFDVTVAPLVDLWGFGKKGQRSSPPSQKEIAEMMGRVGMHHIKVLDDSLILKMMPEVELDLSAVAKGFGVDVLGRVLDRLGYENFLVEIGGEVTVRGLNGDQKWKIGIDRPVFDQIPGTDLEAVLAVTDISMATSGDYRNYFVSEDSVYSHTIDPVTGRPIVNGVASVTVLAPACVDADAMATAIMVMGVKKGIDWIETKPGVEAMVILREKGSFTEHFSSGFQACIQR